MDRIETDEKRNPKATSGAAGVQRDKILPKTKRARVSTAPFSVWGPTPVRRKLLVAASTEHDTASSCESWEGFAAIAYSAVAVSAEPQFSAIPLTLNAFAPENPFGGTKLEISTGRYFLGSKEVYVRGPSLMR